MPMSQYKVARLSLKLNLDWSNMISAKRAMRLVFEPSEEKRNEMVDKLTEEDAKVLLKHCLKVMRESLTPSGGIK